MELIAASFSHFSELLQKKFNLLYIIIVTVIISQ